MFNCYSSYFFYLFICFFTQILPFDSRIEAKAHCSSDFDFNIDVNAIQNCNNLDDKIDYLIDIGMKYQQVTAKKFKYKKFLKQTYKYLEKHDVHVDKKIKKDLKKRVQNRINCRLFGESHNLDKMSTHYALASSKYSNVEYSNGFREGIVEVTIGFVCIASEVPPVQLIGGGVVVDGCGKFVRATIDYIWPPIDERDRLRERERDRDGERPSMADRDRDRDRSRNR